MYYEGERALKEKGEAALKRMPPMRTAQKAGVVVGAGTDAHRVADYNPFVALLTKDYLSVLVGNAHTPMLQQ
jgi:predicted amidohydrolase YtcJ